ncbi:MAG: hypothetical protein FJ088_13645, partial [Deltaproteobacteria bacterium]|nr:hypothetical protein [Deltaproteobacteria bacterium]
MRAFSRTVEKMADAHDKFLAALDRGVVLTAEGIEEWSQVDSDEALDKLIEETGAESTAGYDLPRLRVAVEADRDLLRYFADKTSMVTREQDPKL